VIGAGIGAGTGAIIGRSAGSADRGDMAGCRRRTDLPRSQGQRPAKSTPRLVAAPRLLTPGNSPAEKLAGKPAKNWISHGPSIPLTASRIPGSGGPGSPASLQEASTPNPLTFSDPRDQAFASDGVSRYIDRRRSAMMIHHKVNAIEEERLNRIFRPQVL
jgi:hypothetical protein